MFYEFKNQLPNPNFEGVTDVNPQEVNENASNLFLVDVREEHEYTGELGHASGAKLVVLSTIPEQLNTLPRDKTVVFICRSGGRSAQATAFAQQEGFTNVYNMLGGMMLWNQLALPIET